MPLEAGDFIPELNANNPLGSDPKSEGDDHMRLIKRCTLGSFPGFVGNSGSPKSVTLTEDQINDAALKSEAQVISGAWDFSGNLRLLQGASILARNFADDGDFGLIEREAVNNQINIGADTAADILYRSANSQTSHRWFSGGTEFGRCGNAGLFGLDDIGVMRQMGMLRPPLVSEGADFDIDVGLHRGVVIQLSSPGNFTVSVPQLQSSMSWVMLNRSGNNVTIAEAGSSVRVLAGGSELLAPHTIANNSVVQCYMINSTFCSMWGNGIS